MTSDAPAVPPALRGELCILHLRAVTRVLGKLERARVLLRECADELEALRGEQCYLVTVQSEHIKIGEPDDRGT